MLDALWFFEKQSIRNLANAKRGSIPAILNGDLLHKEKESFRRTKTALDKNSKKWMEWSDDPKSPDYQKFRIGANNLMEKIINKMKNKKIK